MQRRTETYRDKDITIWVCPHGYAPDIVEFPNGAKEPTDKVCGTHGEALIKRCPNPECPSPTYRPDDFEQRFHRPCGAKIPWAEARREEAQVDYQPFNSKYLGRVRQPQTWRAEELIRKLSQSSESSPRELKPEQRQNVVVPRSTGKPVVREIYRSKQLQTAEPNNLNRYFIVASQAIDKPPRQIARGLIKFLKDRGEVVGRGADKGLEDAVTLIVKTLIVAGVLGLLAFFGIQLAIGN